MTLSSDQNSMNPRLSPIMAAWVRSLAPIVDNSEWLEAVPPARLFAGHLSHSRLAPYHDVRQLAVGGSPRVYYIGRRGVLEDFGDAEDTRRRPDSAQAESPG